MNFRLAIILSGTLLAAAAGGLVAALPVLHAVEEASVPPERAPTPDLEVSRLAVMAALRATVASVGDRAAQVELLTGLMAEAGQPSAQAPQAVRTAAPDERVRRDPVQYP